MLVSVLAISLKLWKPSFAKSVASTVIYPVAMSKVDIIPATER